MSIETKAKIIEIIDRTASVRSFRVVPEEKTEFKPGQYLLVYPTGAPDLFKPLSFSNSPTEMGYFEFTKRLSTSEFSETLRRLTVGDFIRIKYPFGRFTFEGEFPKVGFLSGGIGITPIRSMVKNAADRGLKTDMVLFYGNNTENEIPFKSDLDEVEKKNPNFRAVHVIWKPQGAWQGRTGLVTAGLIREMTPDYAERKFFICGPPAMVEILKKILFDELKLPKENIITESFAGY